MKKLNLTREDIIKALKVSARPSIRNAAKYLGVSHEGLRIYVNRLKIDVDKLTKTV